MEADFSPTNLPFGLFSQDGGERRPCLAYGSAIFDLTEAGILPPMQDLNALFAQGDGAPATARRAARAMLAQNKGQSIALLPKSACQLHLPFTIGDYTDFYAGIHHATNAGRMFRPEQPLLPNYKYVPIAYHGRASSVRVSGAPVRRPNGQRKPARDTVPSFGPSRNLDYELELGIWIGKGNEPGRPIPVGEAASHIAGFCLLNDWSARDIQGWEYQPLGPFLAKNFCTTVSPWVIMPDALASSRAPAMRRPDGDPPPMDYLTDPADQASGGLDITLEVTLTPAGGEPCRLSIGNARDLYWTAAQMIAHHTSGGCDLRPGDLLGTGTISGADPGTEGSLLELTEGGRKPLRLPGGIERRFLEDGDTVSFTARFNGGGFGPCIGTVTA